jgi:hypothetical protein
VDQFEEVFTLTTDEAERRHFFELLVTAVTEPHGPLFVILTLRADFYDRPMHYPELFRLIDDHHVSVLPLELDDLRRVIEQPANLPEVQLTFESGLVDQLLFDMQGQSGALPLLEFTLDQLFQRRSGYQLTLQAYHEMGGVKGALSKHAEDTYQGLPSDEHRQAARDIFLRLIEPGTTEQDTTRHRADSSEFARTDPKQAQQMRETLEAFIRARLLTTNQIGGKTTIEVSHEALIREWTRLAEWLHEARNDIVFQRSLSEDVEEWEQEKRPRDRLYRGAQLKKAQEWARHNRPSEQETAFLRASTSQRVLTRVGAIVLALLLLSSMGLAGNFLFFQPDKTLVTTLQDNNGVGSLRWCINNAPSGSTIRFAQGLRGIIELTGGDLTFAGGKKLTIDGPGANQLAISGGNLNAHVHVSKGAIVAISGLSFKNSETVNDAFLFNEGILKVTNSIVSGNKTTAGVTNTTSLTNITSHGGGIENRGVLTLINSTITNNSAISGLLDQGGGIFNEGKLTVNHSTISNNSASGGYLTDGGGIYNSNASNLTVTDSTFSANSSSGSSDSYGGGITNEGTLIVTHSTFTGNSSKGGNNSYGGGIDNFSTGTLIVTDSTFTGNSSKGGKQNGAGGGIVNVGKLTVTRSTFSNNSANSSSSSFGGGIDNYNTGTVMLTASILSNNSASGKQDGQGGGVDNEGKLAVTDSTFSNNSASSSSNDSFGGGIFNSRTGTVMVIASTFSGNSASGMQYGQGGGIDNEGKLTVSRSSFLNNFASSNYGSAFGGGIFNYSTGTLIVTACTFSGNKVSGKQYSQGDNIHNEGKLTMT